MRSLLGATALLLAMWAIPAAGQSPRPLCGADNNAIQSLISPSDPNITWRIVFVSFASNTPLPAWANDMVTELTAFLPAMSNHHQAANVQIIVRPDGYAWQTRHPRSYYDLRGGTSFGQLNTEVMNDIRDATSPTIWNGVKMVSMIYYQCVSCDSAANGYDPTDCENNCSFGGTMTLQLEPPNYVPGFSGFGTTQKIYTWSAADPSYVNSLLARRAGPYVAAHEYGHLLGLPHSPSSDSRGNPNWRNYGKYDLMRASSQGIVPLSGLVPFHVLQLSDPNIGMNWMTILPITDDYLNLHIPDVRYTPVAYEVQVPYSPNTPNTRQRFLLVNYQGLDPSAALFDQRYQNSGLLIFHELLGSNGGKILWDLESARGMFTGGLPDPISGRDQLDADRDTPNLGSPEDFFDGSPGRNMFTPCTNPNTNLYSDPSYLLPQSVPSGISFENIHAEGSSMVVDVFMSPKHNVILPNGGETYSVGSPMGILWQQRPGACVANVMLYISYDGGGNYNLIDGNVANTGSYTWAGPQTASNVCKIRVRTYDQAGQFVEDESDATFTIGTGGSGGGGGSCPFVDTRTAAGWKVENSILGRSLTGTLSLDGYRLKSAPAIVNGRYRLRVRENERESTTLDQVRLVAVDHSSSTRAFALGDRIVLGTKTPPYRVTTSAGTDITGLVSGNGSNYFHAQRGETLLVEVTNGASGLIPELGSHEADGLDPLGEEDQCKTNCDNPPIVWNPGATEGMSPDATVLSSTGILIQGRDQNGVWRTVRERYPREYFDEFVMDTLDQGPVRLVFRGGHDLRWVGRIVPTGLGTPQPLDLLAAVHSRLGDVRIAVGSAGGTTTSLTPGDTLTLDFAATPVPEGQVRDFVLLSRGVYTTIQPTGQRREVGSRPTQFALLQNHPNPFSRVTNIEFALPRSGMVKVEVYDLQGRLIRSLADRWYEAGKWSVEWDRKDAQGNPTTAGVYLYRMSAGSFREQRKMVLLPD